MSLREPRLFVDPLIEQPVSNAPMTLDEATVLFINRWVPSVQREAARKELDDLIDLACRVEPPA